MNSKRTAAALRAVAGTVTCVLLVSGCGSGGDGATPATIEAGDYYPMHVGDRWSYRETLAWGPFGDSTSYTAQSITGTRIVEGTTYVVAATDDTLGTTEQLVLSTPTRVRIIDAAVPSQQFDLIRLPAEPGSSFVQDLPPDNSSDIDGDGTPDPSTMRLTTTTVGLETVVPTAGSVYERSLHLRQDAVITTRRSSDGVVETDTTTADAWFAPGVGLVRLTSRSGDDFVHEQALLQHQPAGLPRKDRTPPALTAMVPDSNVAVHAATPLLLAFDEAVTASITKAVTVTDAGGSPVELSESNWSATGQQVTLVPLLGWSSGRHTVHFGGGIEDVHGNATTALADRTFTVDNRLAATYTLPRRGMDRITSYAGDLLTVFNAPIAPDSATKVVLRANGGVVPAAVEVTFGGSALIVTPAAPLKPSTRYVVDLSGVTAADGSPIANPIDWAFTTASTVSVKPLDGASALGRKNALAAGAAKARAAR